MILDNPFHVLGLLADASVPERARRESQIQAYLRVGRQLMFDDDLYFPGCRRNKGTVDRAVSDLYDARDRIGFGLFWFTESGGVIDGHALRLLRGGDLQGAIAVWARVENRPPDVRLASCLNNLGTACLLAAMSGLPLGRRWPAGSRDRAEYVRRGLRAKAQVVGSLAGADLSTYCRTFGDDIATRDPTGIAERFGEALEEFSEEARKFGLNISPRLLAQVLNDGGPRTAKLADRFARASLGKLEEALAACEDADPSHALVVGTRLMAVAKERLPDVAAVLGGTNIGYTSLADRACEALLNAAVAHWNCYGRSGDASPEAGLKVARDSRSLVRYAHEVACGISVRERGKDNLATLDEIIGEAEMALVRVPLKEWLDRAYALLNSRARPQARMDFVQESLMAATGGPLAVSVISLLEALREQGATRLGPGFTRSDEMVQASSLVCGALMGHAVVAYNESPTRSPVEGSAIQFLLWLPDFFGPVSDLRTRNDPRNAVLPVSQEVWKRLQEITAPWRIPDRRVPPLTRQRQPPPVPTTPSPSSPSPARQGCLVIFLLLAGLAIALSVVSEDDSTDQDRRRQFLEEYDRERRTPASPVQQSSSQLEYTVPAVGTSRVLSLPELRWCVRQQGIVERDARELERATLGLDRDRRNLELNAPGAYASEFQVDKYNAEVSRFNSDLQAYESDQQRHNRQIEDYNSRCGSFQYRPGELERARREVGRSGL